MLLEYGFKNYFSFSEGAEISFRLDSNCPESISEGKPYTSVICVKGANGAGKSHVLRALAFIANFTTRSFFQSPESFIALDAHFESEAPTEMYVEFVVSDSLYRYEVELTDKMVVRETIYRTKAKRVRLIERVGNELTYMPAKHPALRSVILRSNASIVSTLAQYKIDLLDEVSTFFDNINSNVSYGSLHDGGAVEKIGELISGSPVLTRFVSDFLNRCDIGINGLEVHKYEDKESTKYVPYFIHESAGKKHRIHHLCESSGTIKLFRTLPSYFLVLQTGGVMIIDEFDMHLHPVILPLIIDLFLDPETNPAAGQLIFSTHDAAIMDKLGRYRTYLVNKENNESYVYRLDSIPGDVLRNDRPIRPAYESGKIGGVPRL